MMLGLAPASSPTHTSNDLGMKTSCSLAGQGRAGLQLIGRMGLHADWLSFRTCV